MVNVAYCWLTESNRWKHIAGGVGIGVLGNDWYCSMYAGVIAASSLEYKDKAHGGRWDWTDWALTVAGCAAGHGLRWFAIG